eukprot:38491_1
MSTTHLWRCLDCGLLNYNFQCQACFSFMALGGSNPIITISPKPKETTCDCEWIQLEDYPNTYNGSYTRLYVSSYAHNYELICGYDVLANGIYKYNFNSNQWTKIFECPMEDDHINHEYRYDIESVEFNENTDTIYVEASPTVKDRTTQRPQGKNIFLQIDSKTNHYQITNDDHGAVGSGTHAKHGAKTILLRGKKYHPPSYITETWGYQLVYVPERNVLYVIGGMWDNFAGTHKNAIWIYSLDDKRWMENDVSLSMGLSDFGCVLTNDQQYVIIMGGSYDVQEIDYHEAEHGETDNIYVWDLKHNTIKKSKIKCAVPAMYKACITPINMKSDIIVGGYWRKHCGKTIVNTPLDVIGVIQRMYDIGDFIHLFHVFSGGHWVISVSDIINSVES